MKYILAFSSTHGALKAESILKEAGVPFRLEPAPKSISAYCDLVIVLHEAVLAEARGVLDVVEGAGVEAVYKKEEGGMLRCDFCGRETDSVVRVALDKDYDRLTVRHQKRYACPDCSKKKDEEREERKNSSG
ncbi:MAG: DUF3343 domain-containing protein [Thermodesulfobacteriota bacterium]